MLSNPASDPQNIILTLFLGEHQYYLGVLLLSIIQRNYFCAGYEN